MDANIWVAAGDGDLETVKQLLDTKTFDVNAQDENGYFALAAAVSYEHGELAAFLLSRGANVNLVDQDGNTALHYCETVEMAKLLVEHGANLHIANSEGCTPADVALEDGFEDVVVYFVSLGCPMPTPKERAEDEEEEQDGDEENMDPVEE